MSKNKVQFDSGKYDFLGKAKYLVPITLLLVLFGAFQILSGGLNYGIDFAGGTEVQIRFEKTADVSGVRTLLEELKFEGASVQGFGEGNEVLIRFRPFEGKDVADANRIQNEMLTKLTGALTTKFTDNKPEVRRVDSVGPQVGDQLKRNAVLATFYSLLAMLIYIGLRFDYKYAPGAIICLFHDAIVTLAIFTIVDMEVSIQTMAAILTLIGYSINDTIITFDRIRENVKLYPDVNFYSLVNRSINDMLSRTILTNLTAFLACTSLYVFADGVIREIGFTLGIGIIIGTYSSVYIAAPLVIWMDSWENRRSERLRQMAKA